MAFDKDGNLVVVAHREHLVLKLSSTGALLQHWGNEEHGGLNNPFEIAVDQQGFLYISDTDNSRVIKFTADGQYAGLLVTSGDGPDQVNRPQGIAIDPHGNIYVADTVHGRILKFDSSGTLIATWK